MFTIFSRIRAKLEYRFNRKLGIPFLANVGNRNDAQHSKRALLMYLTEPFCFHDTTSYIFSRHSNWWQNREIANILDSMGYVVDVVSNTSNHFVPTVHYDLFIGSGPPSIRVARMMSESTRKIYIATGLEPGLANSLVLARASALEQRRKVRVPYLRLADLDPTELKAFDALACFGNSYTREAYRPYHQQIYAFNNCAASRLPSVVKNHSQARTGYLFLASHGLLRKGLDLLLELFPQLPNLTLHICAAASKTMERDFVSCYRKELHQTRNIHYHGWVPLLSRKMKAICRDCSFMISPSAGEGQSGAVIDAMHLGLIPLVSRECGVDTNGFGITLQSCELDEIKKVLVQTSTFSPERCEEMSMAANAAARTDYSQQAFSRRWREILEDVTRVG